MVDKANLPGHIESGCLKVGVVIGYGSGLEKRRSYWFKRIKMNLNYSLKWHGPGDQINLAEIRRAGASGVVTALHDLPHGAVWPMEMIKERKQLIEKEGLNWTVAENVPVHEAIKSRTNNFDLFINNYRKTLRNLSANGVRTICYNFMPFWDWGRIKLEQRSAGQLFYFDWVDLAVFDLKVLGREEKGRRYGEGFMEKVEARFEGMSAKRLETLAGLMLNDMPKEERLAIKKFQEDLEQYENMGGEGLRKNLISFLNDIGDVCEQEGVQMAIRPDPPYPVFGLPKIVSDQSSLEEILNAERRPFNGICFCTASLGEDKGNDLSAILKVMGDRVYLAHLGKVNSLTKGEFSESGHLDGDLDMYSILSELIQLNYGRKRGLS